MESTDGSAKLAKELGCKVITHKRMPAPEPDARIAAINASTGDWILVFDADMRLPAETAREMRRLVEQDNYDLVRFSLVNVFFGVSMRYGHGAGYFLKFFRRSVFNPPKVIADPIHQFFRVSLSGRSVYLSRKYYVIHHAYPDIPSFVKRHAAYAEAEAKFLLEAGRSTSLFKIFWLPTRRFLGNIIRRSGWRDGIPGFVLSGLVSAYVFQREAILWEMCRRQEKRIREK
jgi:glycosyltransferase involved in cell wall biosynthesis